MVNNVLMTPLMHKHPSPLLSRYASLRFGEAPVCDKTKATLLCLQSPSKTCLNTVADKDAYKQGDGHEGQWLWQHRVFPRCRWAQWVCGLEEHPGQLLWPHEPPETSVATHPSLSWVSCLVLTWRVLFLHLTVDPSVLPSYIHFARWASEYVKPQLSLHLHLWHKLCHQRVLLARLSHQQRYAMAWACRGKHGEPKPEEVCLVPWASWSNPLIPCLFANDDRWPKNRRKLASVVQHDTVEAVPVQCAGEERVVAAGHCFVFSSVWRPLRHCGRIWSMFPRSLRLS